ncbi:GNAT family N-acetyltransferase [Haloterrigena alkaliphila]|uniref:GNAT family N-acetyltransferase n=1 Tax=Haloterrigena alkaliphila TaxID=2816475 RepID=UPI001CED6AD0|nr:GNAT family N-acetyltransferase [Haloterrigena alkaliphila]QSX00521.2 GNAT family N-acetyltransferase [Haloterrigena alkaliphila]
MTSGDSEPLPDGYTVRPYRRQDREGLLSLYQDVLSERLTDRWFEWKYEANPYADDVHVFVAEFDGRIVGAAGFWHLDLSTGDRTMRVIQSCDGAVRSDHRRRGIYTNLFEAGLGYYADAGIEFVFDFPNELTKATFEKHGWRLVEEREAHYRLQRPAAVVGDRLDGPGAGVVRKGAELVARGYHAAKSRRRSAPTGIDVERTDGVPPATLASVYRRDVPDRFHLVRDETFYRWRFDNPHWDYTTYVGRYEGTPLAAIVTGTRTIDGANVTRLTDVVPLSSDSSAGRKRALAAALESVLEANADAALVVAPSGVLPSSLRSRYGFHSNQRFPLSRFTTPTAHGVYLLSAIGSEGDADGEEWRVDGKRLTDPDSWRITFAEYDTG